VTTRKLTNVWEFIAVRKMSEFNRSLENLQDKNLVRESQLLLVSFTIMPGEWRSLSLAFDTLLHSRHASQRN